MDIQTIVYGSLFYSFANAVLEVIRFLMAAIIPGVFMYKIYDHDPLYDDLLNKLDGLHVEKRGQKPLGIVIGRWYYARVTANPGSFKFIEIWCHKSFMRGIEIGLSRKVVDARDDIIVYVRGNHYDLKWIKFTPNAAQLAFMREVSKRRQAGLPGVYLVYGPPCTGKSALGKLVAKDNNFALYYDFKYKSGFNIGQMAKKVILLNEVDEILDKIINKETNADLSKSDKKCYKKSVWNGFIDVACEIDTIVILTMNTDPAKYDRTEPALLRDKRISARFHFTEAIE